jgi:hypothetical protein
MLLSFLQPGNADDLYRSSRRILLIGDAKMPGFDAGLEIGFAGEEELKIVYNVARQRLSCTAFGRCCSLDEQEGKAVAPAGCRSVPKAGL